MTNNTIIIENMTMKEISKIALNKGITLSYKDENGKRKRLTKPQLIKAIAETKSNVRIENSNSSVKNDNNESVEFNLKSVVIDSKKLLSIGKVEQVKMFISKLINDINNERKNKLLVKHMSMKLEILKSLIKTHNIRKEVY